MKILCLGNNSNDTAEKANRMAQELSLPCHGLLNKSNNSITANGVYYTNIFDLTNDEICNVAEQCTKVVMLDQSRDSYSHPNTFLHTVLLAQQLDCEWQNPNSATNISYWQDLVDDNPAFCIFPFIELLTENGKTKVCCRSTKTIKPLNNIQNWTSDHDYSELRSKIIAGEKIPEYCRHCYREEDLGIISARKFETVEWANRLDLKNIDDLLEISKPAYYEVRASNTCNLQCRTCTPEYSHLLKQEYEILGLDFHKVPDHFSNFDFVDLANIEKIYISGGEPTAQVEFFDFLDRCINSGQTDFEVMINTNANKFSKKFLTQIEQFSNLQFIVSVDGYSKLNHYIRWPSIWDDTVDNIKSIIQRHQVTVNSVLSIYNIAEYSDLLEFIEKQFPTARVHAQIAISNNNRLTPLNHPNPKLVMARLENIKKLKCYQNDMMLASVIDSIITHYQTAYEFNPNLWKDFLRFNDLLDTSRNVKLANYIPELENYRHLS